MTLTDIASIASVASSIAVLSSLVYLSLQLRQSARNQVATVHHDRLGHTQAYLTAIFSNPEMMDIQMRGQAADETMSTVQANQFVFSQYANLLFYEEYFFMRRDGMIDEARYLHTISNLRLIAQEPGTRAAWGVLKVVFTPAFVAFFDEVMRNTAPIDNPGFFAASFKALAAVELATARAASNART
jgi:hypothetical protein